MDCEQSEYEQVDTSDSEDVEGKEVTEQCWELEQDIEDIEGQINVFRDLTDQ